MSVRSEPLLVGADGKRRCCWCASDPDYQSYHDLEWGLPVADDTRLFEKICLEGFQAGLSWLTILRKRENFREAFARFDIESVARFNTRSVDRLLRNAGIVRHRGKIEAAINNARRAIKLIDECGSLASYLWTFEPPTSQRPKPVTLADLPAKTAESTALSRDLRGRGWSFVGPTTMYAFMQSMGMVNDHLTGCCCRSPVDRARREFTRPGR